jgi:acyl-CoA synthetase (AMP-forming)/AMP-acid ligase II
MVPGRRMIVTGSENMYSAEVENAVACHPAVVQCAVIGVPDPDWGERVHAVVVLRSSSATCGASTGATKEREIH